MFKGRAPTTPATASPEANLTPDEKLLYEMLVSLRSKEVRERKLPAAYMVFSNRELINMVKIRHPCDYAVIN